MPHIILFYKYAPLSSDANIMALYQKALADLCKSLNLTGRILVGMSDDAEGINGTLAGNEKKDVWAFCRALLGKEWCLQNPEENDYDSGDSNGINIKNSCRHRRDVAIEIFWEKSLAFATAANIPVVEIDTPEDFKWSNVESNGSDSNNGVDAMFPDLQIKLVKEIIGTGGVLSSVSIKDTSEGYLSPEQWHEEMKKIKEAATAGSSSSSENKSIPDDTVLIDCRNHKEYEIGHFEGSIDPNTKTFEQFPRWVQENKSALKDKKILMYCTGGIRCEKASAYMRRELETVSETTTVKHLKGGIHKYLDKYGGDGFFSGSNFVFDRRVGVDADEHTQNRGKDSTGTGNGSANKRIVGHCLYCKKSHDQFTPDAVCTVCRELTLVCADCKPSLHKEYHCVDHQYLKNCYFSNLSRFTQEELNSQLHELETLFSKIAVGKRYKNLRRTLQRQVGRINHTLVAIKSGTMVGSNTLACRSCGDVKCDGRCWGVHGLKRKLALQKNPQDLDEQPKKAVRLSSNQRSGKVLQKQKDIEEIKRFDLQKPPNSHRCQETCIRCPPPFLRILSSSVKGKWVGKSIESVLKTEFHDFEDPDRMNALFRKSLVQLNGIPVNSEAALTKGVNATKAVSQDLPLKNMDIISRITHWHEPPVLVPEKIAVQKLSLPNKVIEDLSIRKACNDANSDFSIYCIDKPSSVPVHPTGPYLQNSLTIMVEAQEGLETRSLLPCHRLDRCTSGLTLCCTNPAVARCIQAQMNHKEVEKIYVARVKGKFPSKLIDHPPCNEKEKSLILKAGEFLYEAPIGVVDIKKGLRAVIEGGKPAMSKFRLLGYDFTSNTSLVECQPLTGRQHQLRVHLKELGFPIHNDVLYCDQVENRQRILKADVIKAVTTAIGSKIEEKGFSTDQIEAAREMCSCCQGEVEVAFNSAQLLQSGAIIDLHARKYIISFTTNKTQKKKADAIIHDESLGKIECKIDVPAWAKNFVNTNAELDVAMAEWLNALS